MMVEVQLPKYRMNFNKNTRVKAVKITTLQSFNMDADAQP